MPGNRYLSRRTMVLETSHMHCIFDSHGAFEITTLFCVEKFGILLRGRRHIRLDAFIKIIDVDSVETKAEIKRTPALAGVLCLSKKIEALLILRRRSIIFFIRLQEFFTLLIITMSLPAILCAIVYADFVSTF